MVQLAEIPIRDSVPPPSRGAESGMWGRRFPPSSFDMSGDFGMSNSFADPTLSSSSSAQPLDGVNGEANAGNALGINSDLDFDWRNMLA